MLSNETILSVIKKYFQKDNILTDHQISSYNHLIDDILPNILNQVFPIIVNDFSDKINSIIK